MSTQHHNSCEMDMSREKITALRCLKLIQDYAWLLDAFVLDFYTEDHWGRLPPLWREVLSQTSLEELGGWLTMTKKCSHRVWPLSLLALRSSAKAYSLPREQVVIPDKVQSNEKVALFSEEIEAGKETECLLHENLKQLFVKHVKPKKRHETVVMAKLCANAALRSGVGCIVDVGGGKGHLSRLLAFGYGLRVFCIDAQSDLVLAAKDIDKQVEYTASKYLDESYVHSLPTPEYIAMTVGNSEEALNQFKKEILGRIQRHPDEEVVFGIVGLHPCGDLAPTLLRLFANLKEAKFICIASCCYMKLSVIKSDEYQGYPLSNYFQKMPKSLTNLTYEALEVSCHALEAYCLRLQMQQYEMLKIHCFRAALEKLIVKHRPDLKHTGLRSVKHFDKMDFPTYVMKAMDRVDVAIPLSDIINPDTVNNLERWKDVVALYSLRLLLAPLVETAVILDRLFFLQEEGTSSLVIAGFDPVVSPRNLIIQGRKR